MSAFRRFTSGATQPDGLVRWLDTWPKPSESSWLRRTFAVSEAPSWVLPDGAEEFVEQPATAAPSSTIDTNQRVSAGVPRIAPQRHQGSGRAAGPNQVLGFLLFAFNLAKIAVAARSSAIAPPSDPLASPFECESGLSAFSAPSASYCKAPDTSGAYTALYCSVPQISAPTRGAVLDPPACATRAAQPPRRNACRKARSRREGSQL